MHRKYFSSKEQAHRISKNTETAYLDKYPLDNLTYVQKVIYENAFINAKTLYESNETERGIKNILYTTINRKEDLLSCVSGLLLHYDKEDVFNCIFDIYTENLEDCNNPILEEMEDILNILSGYCNPFVKVDKDGIYMDIDYSEEKFQELYMCDWKSGD